KAHPLKQGHALVEGLEEHPPVEVEPAQFPIEVEMRMAQIGVLRYGPGGRRPRHRKNRISDLKPVSASWRLCQIRRIRRLYVLFLHFRIQYFAPHFVSSI